MHKATMSMHLLQMRMAAEGAHARMASPARCIPQVAAAQLPCPLKGASAFAPALCAPSMLPDPACTHPGCRVLAGLPRTTLSAPCSPWGTALLKASLALTMC